MKAVLSWSKCFALAVAGLVLGQAVLWAAPSEALEPLHQPLPGPLVEVVASIQDPESLADLQQLQLRACEVIRAVGPATVGISFGNSSASGVVISPEGLVLTAAHVGGPRADEEVSFIFPDGRKARGKTLGANHAVDAGLMQITDEGPWPHVSVGSADGSKPGDWVVALGHPGGFDPDRPVVARLGRVIRSTSRELRTDCTIVGGDSGGPLFDLHGRVIGVHSRISDSVADNFHVPISTYLTSWDRLARGDHWGDRQRSRAWAGMQGDGHTEGCMLHMISENGPAAKAGLKVGDIVTRLNGSLVEDFSSIIEVVSEADPGDELTVEIIREEVEWGMLLTVEERPRRRGRRGRR